MPFGSCVRGLLAPIWCLCRWLFESSTGYRCGRAQAGRIATPFRDRAVARRDGAPNTSRASRPTAGALRFEGWSTRVQADALPAPLRAPPGYRLPPAPPSPGPHPCHPASALRTPASPEDTPGPRNSTNPNPRAHTYCTKEPAAIAGCRDVLRTSAMNGEGGLPAPMIVARGSRLDQHADCEPSQDDLQCRHHPGQTRTPVRNFCANLLLQRPDRRLLGPRER